MKILYFGGQKSGKSLLAEQKTLSLSNRAYYVATYNSNYSDIEMQNRVKKHKLQRRDRFITIEEPLNIDKVIREKNTYLVDCLSMWILNSIDIEFKYIKKQLEYIKNIDSNIVFVLNDVNSGIIPIDKMSREFIDRSGVVGQIVAKFCDEVYEAKLGIEIRLK